MLAETVAEFTVEERARFLQFVTGAPHLPMGGLGSLRPALNVVRMESESETPECYLPSSLVCGNVLRLPPYGSKKLMKSKLLLAMAFGNDSFHLG
jgi:E3 ubiquitin-protein ligase TRIP12